MKRFLCRALIVALCVFPPAAQAGIEEAKQFVSRIGNDALAIVSSNKIAEKDKMPKLEALFVQHVDIEWVAKFVLGRYWRQATPEQRRQTRYLIAAPLENLHNTLFGLLVVEKMPFFSLQDETLQTINLLLGYYSDGLSMHALSEGIRKRHPECPLNFAFELQRLWHLQQATNLASVVVALEILPRAIELDIPQQLQRLKRALDENWQMQGKGRQLLATLMPIGTRAAAEGYIARIEEWGRQREGQTLPKLGIFPHVLVLGEDGTPEQLIERLEQIAHA